VVLLTGYSESPGACTLCEPGRFVDVNVFVDVNYFSAKVSGSVLFVPAMPTVMSMLAVPPSMRTVA
jgi:hypothetical protein